MKKILLITILLVSPIISAQKVGVKGGVNIAQTTRNKQNSRVAYHFGGMYKININQILSLQPEILYSAQGFVSNSNTSTNTTQTYKLDYINIPVMLKYYLTDNLNLELGPQFSFNIKAEEEYKSKNTSYTQKIDNIKTFDFGMNAGVGYELYNGLNFGLRYNLGMTEIYKIGYDNSRTQNSVLQISLGYLF